MERHGARLGGTIGAIAGLVFVLVNAGGLPGSAVLRTLGVLAFAGAVVSIIRSSASSPPPARGALRTYGLCVAAEVLAIPVGANLAIRVFDEPDLVLCWVVVVVGVHFVPFARAFSAPVFLPLGLTLVAVGLLGGVGVLAGVDDAHLWAGVLAGFVLLGFGAYGALVGRRRM